MTIRLNKEEQSKSLQEAGDIYKIMQRILMRESKVDRNREHVWTISLDSTHRVLAIELISMGSVRRAVVEPMEVFSLPLQKRAVKVVLVHNHPSGEVQPSKADKDMCDLLIQCGLIMDVPVLDFIIISEKKYYSFARTGLLDELALSLKYVPPYKLKMIGRLEGIIESAKKMKEKGVPIKTIMEYTGLSRREVGKIKT